MKLTLFILGCLLSTFTVAGVYKCTDANDNTEYRSTPCQVGRQNVELNIKTGTGINLDVTNKQQILEQKEQLAKQEQQKIEQDKIDKTQADINKDAMSESAKNQLLIKNNPDKFSAFSIPPYVPEKLPNLVKPYQSRLNVIERLRRQAAEKALASNECIRVESDELNSKSTKDALTILINCSSGKSFYFNEQELIK